MAKGKVEFKRDTAGNLYAIKNGVNIGRVATVEVKSNGTGSKKRKDRK